VACACDCVTGGASVAVFSVTGGTAGVPVALAAAALFSLMLVLRLVLLLLVLLLRLLLWWL
jgi:hypothetical protein